MKKIKACSFFKKIVFSFLIVLLSSSIPTTVYAHPGKTDDNGGHFDRATGEYHYHHGYEAHQHTDMDGDGVPDCPFDYDDKTRQSSSSSSNISSYLSSATAETKPPEYYTITKTEEVQVEVLPTWIYYCFAMFALVVLILSIVIKNKQGDIDALNKVLSDQKRKNELKISEMMSDMDTQRKEAESESERLHAELERLNIDLEKMHSDSEKLQSKNRILTFNLELAEKKKSDVERELQMARNNAPSYISFAKDGMPVYWKPNIDKPYGDYTVYLNTKKGIYHFDYLCASYTATKTHIFKAVKYARPCQKCASKSSELAIIPDWFIQNDESTGKEE